VGDVRASSIYAPVASGTGGVWRVEVDGWTAILKLIRHDADATGNWQSGEAEGHWYYWRREVLAFQSGLLASLPGEGLRAPECRGIAERSDGSVALWLEDLGPETATSWPLSRYELAARHLGEMQGAYPSGMPLPDRRWLSRNWLRDYVERRRDDIPDAAEEAALLAELAGLPQTLCHFDLHPANLFDVEGRTVLVDWSFVGIGSIGEDAGNLVPDAVLDFHVPPDDVDDLFDRVAAGYADGVGLDLALVRRAMRVAIAAKYFWIAPALRRAQAAEAPMLNRRPFDEAVKWWAPMVEWLSLQLGRD
jgi:hypothetical protein